jgi:hypothetical protein
MGRYANVCAFVAKRSSGRSGPGSESERQKRSAVAEGQCDVEQAGRAHDNEPPSWLSDSDDQGHDPDGHGCETDDPPRLRRQRNAS